MGTRGGELLIPVSTISENGVAKSSTPTATTATPSSHGHEVPLPFSPFFRSSQLSFYAFCSYPFLLQTGGVGIF